MDAIQPFEKFGVWFQDRGLDCTNLVNPTPHLIPEGVEVRAVRQPQADEDLVIRLYRPGDKFAWAEPMNRTEAEALLAASPRS